MRHPIALLIALLLGVGCKSSQPAEILCGGAMNFACPSDMYCHMSEGCGGLDGEGVCKPRPLQCPGERKPICGCDGETYSSACFAAAKGVTPKSEGECPNRPRTEMPNSKDLPKADSDEEEFSDEAPAPGEEE